MSNHFTQSASGAFESSVTDHSSHSAARSRNLDGAPHQHKAGPHMDKTSLESRSRMISFRVTAEEFERFRKLCIERGLQNVSQVVRLAVNQLFEDTSLLIPDDSISSRVGRLEARLEAMSKSVAELDLRLEGTQDHVIRLANSGGR